MLQVGETTVALVVGDVVGHGPPAAAVMGQLRSVLAAQLLDGCSPAAALERLDRFAARVAGSAGSTCACLLYDWSTGVLRWALAGHPPVLLVGGPGGARFLGGIDTGGSGAVLGVRGRPPYAEGSAEVAAGSSIVLYTDGLVERRGELLDTGLDRLATAAVGLAGLGPAELVAALAEATLGNAGPADDVALLVVRAVPAPLAGRLPARGESMRVLRRLVADWERAAGLPAELAEDLELALGEAGANAAEHAYPEAERGRVRVHRRAARGRRHRGHGARPRPLAPGAGGQRSSRTRAAGDRGDRCGPADRPRPRRDPRAVPGAGPGAGVTGRIGPGADRRPGRSGSRRRCGPSATGSSSPATSTSTGATRSVRHCWARPPAAAPCVVDLTAVRYLSSAGVALLAEAAALAGPRLSIVVAPGSAPARVCALTGLGTAVPLTEAGLPELAPHR